MVGKLIGLSGPIAGRTFELASELTTLGRDPDNDIVIEAQWVSRRHCELRKVKEGVEIVDRGSHNGTAVNDVPVKQRLLRGGDRITLGGARFLFVDGESEVPAPELELQDVPLPSRATVELRADDALYLGPERLRRSKLGEKASRNALAAMLSLVRLVGEGDVESLPERILGYLFELVEAERGAILMGPSLEELDSITVQTRDRDGARRARGQFAVSRTVLGRVFAEKTAILSNRVAEELPGKSLLASRVSSLVCLPLITEGRIVGAIYLDSRSPGADFAESQLELLMGLASVAAGALERARQLGRLRAVGRGMREELAIVHEMVGESSRLKQAQQIIARAAGSDATVLIEGESGTGKELAARAIHFNSPRRDGPLVKVDCTGLNENLLASDLFGHERGAFTGAIQQKKGKLEVASGGTVFLDEIGELPLALQSRLLRVLQDREFERVGGTHPIRVDIRLVAATNRDLTEEVKKGNFREDLFHRLNVIRLSLPPLRERPEDIELLARYFATEHGKRVKRPVAGVASEALAILKRYEWPGNVRELANAIERAVVLGTTELILPEDLPELMVEGGGGSEPAASSYHEAVAEKKKALILDAIGKSGGSITGAARILGLHPNYLHRLIRNLGLRDRIQS